MPRDIAIDLGTANTLAFVRGRGIVLRVASILALDERTGDIVALGDEAWAAVEGAQGRLSAVRPLRNGAITDFQLTERLIRMVFQRAGVGRFSHPRAIIAVSSAISPVERRAVEEAAQMAGARGALLIDEPVAAGLGAGMPIDQPWGNCVIDVGGGTTEVAVIAMGGIIASRAIRVGGFDLDDAVRSYLRLEHGLVVGERAAEEIKKAVASAHPSADEGKSEISGRDLATGQPRTALVDAAELRAAIDDIVVQIVEAVRATMADTPAELSHDVLERGVVLAGGGALVRGLAARLEEDTGIPVRIADEPLDTVCVGAGRALDAVAELKQQGILG